MSLASRVEPADLADRKAGHRLLGGPYSLLPGIRTVIADAGHASAKPAHARKQQDGCELQIVKRRQQAFKTAGLTWIVEQLRLAPGATAGSAKPARPASHARQP